MIRRCTGSVSWVDHIPAFRADVGCDSEGLVIIIIIMINDDDNDNNDDDMTIECIIFNDACREHRRDFSTDVSSSVSGRRKCQSLL